jgi:hypothetical protein
MRQTQVGVVDGGSRRRLQRGHGYGVLWTVEAAMSPFFYAGGEVVGMQVLDADGICGELEVTLFAFLF